MSVEFDIMENWNQEWWDGYGKDKRVLDYRNTGVQSNGPSNYQDEGESISKVSPLD